MKRLLSAVVIVVGVSLVIAAPLPEPKFAYIDLQAKTNHKLSDDLHTGTDGNDLKVLPRGEQMLGGVKFKIGDGFIQLGSKVLEKMPAKVEGIPVGRTFAKLHILHATGFGGGPNKEGDAWFVKDGTAIGEYRVNFEDRTAAVIPIVYGQDVRDWFYVEGEMEPSKGKVAWKGANAFSKQVGAGIRLYASTWENPTPNKKVVSIDYLSRKGDTVAAPFCVAMTVAGK